MIESGLDCPEGKFWKIHKHNFYDKLVGDLIDLIDSKIFIMECIKSEKLRQNYSWLTVIVNKFWIN